MKSKPAARAFVLHEAVTVVIVGVAVAALLAVASTRSRSLASLGESMANLRKMHQATASFADDNESRFATFTWRKGTSPSQYPDLASAATDLQAAANQAVDIIRRQASFPTMPKVTSGWLPYPSYSFLVLADYAGAELPARWLISAEDPQRLAFALDRSQWAGAGINARWAFSSSYEVPAAFWAIPDSGPEAVSQSTYNTWSIPGGARFGGDHLDSVAYPANKALYYDRHQRHFGPRQGYFMHEEARVPLATVDGAVSVRRGADCNPGWQPRQPDNPNPTYIYYAPATSGQFAWDPPALDPSGQDLVVGRYRWTRNALLGRDVDAPEVP